MSVAKPKRVLFLERPTGNLAAQAAERFRATVARLGMGWTATVVPAAEATPDAIAGAAFVVGFGDGPAGETWPADPSTLDAEVADLVARLFTGAPRIEKPPTPKEPTPPPKPAAAAKPKKGPVVKVSRETKGRRGKGVTLVSDLPPHLGEAGLNDLAATLKSRCGTGGTVKDGVVEIQGDQRDRVQVELERLGYTVKRSGG